MSIENSAIKYKITTAIENIRIYPIEFSNTAQSRVTIRQDINAPTQIAMKHLPSFKSENPARKLPDQTPVSGRGSATNVVKIRYFLNVDFSFSSSVVFMLYFDLTALAIKPVVLDLILRVISIAIKLGISEPINANKKACHG